MKQYPLGSICIIIETGPKCANFLKRECTVVGLPGCYEKFPDQYRIEIQGDDRIWYAEHFRLKLKRFPPDLNSDCEEFMRKVLTPVDLEVEEAA